MKQKLLLKTILLLCALVVGSGNIWGDTKTEGFESASTGTNYQGTVTVSTEKSDCSIGWEIYYGNVSTSSKISGNNSAALRLYTSANYGYLKTTTAIDGLSKVTFKAKAAGSNGAKIKVNISYSPNGTSWTAIETDKSLTTSSASYSVDIPSGGKYFQIAISSNSTKPSSSSAQLTIDDVVFTYTSSVPSSAAAFAETTPAINYPATKTYSQAATTADGYTGTVTYEITNNTAGATIEGSTVTVTGGGSVTVKATAPAVDGKFYETTATYTLTVNDTRIAAGLEYAEDAQIVYKGSTLTAPTLTNPNSVDVTYSSSDETIATVDASGNVTGVAVGSATITATFAGDDDYLPGSASYTVTVKKPAPAGAIFYESVSGYSSDSDGTAAIAATYTNLDSDNWSSFSKVYAGKKQAGDEDGHLKFGSSDATGEAVTKSIALTGSGKLTYKVMQFNGTNAGALTVSVTGATATGDLSVTGTDAWVEHTVNLTGAAGNVVITFATTSGSSNLRIRLDDVTVIQYPSVTIDNYQWATFVSAAPLDFSTYNEVKAYIVTGRTDKVLAVTQMEGTVPANTPLLLNADAANTYAIPVAASSTTNVNSNLLKAGTGAAVSAESGKTKYVLGVKDGKAAFMKIAGTPATVPVGKAYLQFNETINAPFMNFFFDEDAQTTAVNDVRSKMEEGSKEYFNLNGQRVAQPTKGLYIVNGKKVLVK